MMKIRCNHFLPCIVGKKGGKCKFKQEKVNDIATVSDKAFVLLVLKNIWDNMMTITINDYYQPRKRKKTMDNKNFETTNNANSTTEHEAGDKRQSSKTVITGQWTSAWHGSRQYGGWSPEGIDHINKLVKAVIQDRQNNRHFQAQYEIWLNKSKSKKEKVKQPVVSVYQDLTSLGV